jgi:hypothetical protein
MRCVGHQLAFLVRLTHTGGLELGLFIILQANLKDWMMGAEREQAPNCSPSDLIPEDLLWAAKELDPVQGAAEIMILVTGGTRRTPL